MRMLWYIAAGSALGGVGRYLVSGAVQWSRAGLYAALSVVLSLAATALGFLVARWAITVPTGLDP